MPLGPWLNHRLSHPFARDCSPNECLYHHLQAVGDAVCMQFLIEGEGALDHDRLIEAVGRATAASPGATLRLVGRQLVEAAGPVPVQVAPDAAFDGDAFSALPHLHRKLDVTQGPGAEVVVFGSANPRLLIRVFHGVMDGKGAMAWIENIFRALRGEPLVEAREALTDVALLDRLPAHDRVVPLRPRYRVKPQAPGPEEPVVWHRFSLPGRQPALLARVAARLAATATDATSRFMLPVDMRRHAPDLACTANLTLPIFLDAPRDVDWRHLNGEMIAQLMANAELNRAAAAFPIIHAVPRVPLRLALAGGLRLLRLSGRFPVTAILSHLGKVDLARLSGGGFEARAFCSLPVHVPFAPLALVIAETEAGSELVFSARAGHFSRAELAALLPGDAA